MRSDLVYALRRLRKSPGFTVIALLTLALGIGLTTSMFSLMNALLFKPVDLPQASHLIRVFKRTPQSAREAVAPATFLDLQRQSGDFAQLAAFRFSSFAAGLAAGESSEQLTGLRVSDGFFAVAGVRPELGRTFDSTEDRPGGNRVAILSHRTWRQRFGGSAAVIGRTVRIDGAVVTIVGVMPESFHDTRLWGPAALFLPLALTDSEKTSRTEGSLQIIGRSAEGVGVAQVDAHLRALAETIARDHPGSASVDSVQVVTLGTALKKRGNAMITLLLIGLSGLVLLIACANLAGLQLTRAAARSHEFAIRAALGASRRRMLGPVVAEGLVLAAGGGLLGLLVAAAVNGWIAHAIASLDGEFLLSIDGRVLLFAAITSGLAGLVFSLVPARHAARVSLSHTLKSGTTSRQHARVRSVLVVGQFGLALMLVTTAGLFIRGADRLVRADHGWNLDRVIQGTLPLSGAEFADATARGAFCAQLEARLAALPGAESATVAGSLPLARFSGPQPYLIAGREPPPKGREPLAFANSITASYFQTTGGSLVAGRGFAAGDHGDSAPVVLINESMAAALFPETNPLGQRIGRVDSTVPRWMEIVGVVRDVGTLDPESPLSPFQVYRPLLQEPPDQVTFAVRARTEVPALAAPIRRTIAAMAPDLPLRDLAPAADLIRREMAGFDLINTMLGGFAALGLFLASLGIYGVISRTVLQRTAEIGVRLALGAQAHDILRLVLGGGLRLTAIGVALGAAGTWAIGRWVGSMIPRFPPLDPVDLIVLVLALVVVALCACYLPARRAAHVDPMESLRSE